MTRLCKQIITEEFTNQFSHSKPKIKPSTTMTSSYNAKTPKLAINEAAIY